MENRFNKARKWLVERHGYFKWTRDEGEGTRYPDYESAREATVRRGGRTEKRILYLSMIED